MMNIDKLRIKLMEKATFICWPWGGAGNAVSRVISAHQEEYWWHPDFNMWGYDEKITCPLQYPETQDTQKTLQSYFYATAHIPCIFYPHFYDLKNEKWIDSEKEINESIKNQLLQKNNIIEDFVKKVVKGEKTFIWQAGHISAKDILERHPNITKIINCYLELSDIEKSWQLPPKLQNSAKNYLKNMTENTKILNINVENLFSKEYSIYEKEFDQLSNFLNFSYPRKKAVRAYSLYYNDRKEIYGHLDKETRIRTQ